MEVVDMSTKKISLVFMLIVLVFILGCSSEPADTAETSAAPASEDEPSPSPTDTPTENPSTTAATPTDTPIKDRSEEIKTVTEENPSEEIEKPATATGWKSTTLEDTLTGKTFRVTDFKGKTVLLESFAVWCPTCLKQQKQMAKLKQVDGEEIVHISLDTDPNEDAALVKGHAEKNNFDWYFAVSPTSVSQQLIDEFGISVVNAPSAPVVMVCKDQSTRMLERGVKSAEDLEEEVRKGCSA
jgi:thiol-disulfide isomerase/thioredoxin